MPETELLNLRTINKKTFDLGNGRRRLEVYGGPIHYLDGSGLFQDIDEGFTEADSGGFSLKFSKLAYLVRAGEDSTRRVYPDRNDLSYWIDIGKPFASMGAPTKTRNSWLWDFAHASIRVIFGASSLKFEAILKDSSAPTSIAIPFSVTGLTRSGNIILHNGVEVARLAKPWAIDANGTLKTCSATFGSGSLTISVNTTGLTFPVRVDPSLTVQPCEKNTSLVQGDANSAYGPGGSYGNLGWLNTRCPGGSNQDKVICDYDTTSISTAATVTSATFSMYYYSASGTTPAGRTYTCYKMRRQDWVEAQATWNVYKTGSSWGTAGASNTSSDIDTTDAATATMPAVNNWIDFDVAAQVQAAVTAGVRSLFLVLDPNTSGTNYGALFYDRTYAGDTTKIPKLVVNYTTASNTTVTPDTVALTLTTYAPVPSITRLVVPDTLSLTLTTYAPDITATENKTVTPGTLALNLTTYAPVITSDLSYITLNGNVTNINDTEITDRGFVWDTNTHTAPGNVPPDLAGYTQWFTESGTFGTGTFSHDVQILENTTLYFRAWARNDYANYGYGDEQTITVAVYPTDPMQRVSNIKRSFFAGQGGVGVYDCELILGGITNNFMPPIDTRVEKSIFTPPPPLTAEQNKQMVLDVLKRFQEGKLTQGMKPLPPAVYGQNGLIGPPWIH